MLKDRIRKDQAEKSVRERKVGAVFSANLNVCAAGLSFVNIFQSCGSRIDAICVGPTFEKQIKYIPVTTPKIENGT